MNTKATAAQAAALIAAYTIARCKGEDVIVALAEEFMEMPEEVRASAADKARKALKDVSVSHDFDGALDGALDDVPHTTGSTTPKDHVKIRTRKSGTRFVVVTVPSSFSGDQARIKHYPNGLVEIIPTDA